MTRTQQFGKMTVPSPGFGAMGMSHHRGPTNDEVSLKTLAKAVELGCTFWDTATASVYGCGKNEELLGRFLKESGVDRNELFIASKCGFPIDFENRTQGDGVINTKEHINEYIEGSISRLGTNPDLYYLHRMNLDTPLEESIGALAKLKTNGKCKYIGLSECKAETLRHACAIAHIDAVQIEYSPWCTDHERDGLIETARELDVTIIAYSPLGRGVLTGAYRDATLFQQENDNRGSIPKYNAENLPTNLRLVDEMTKIADKKGCTPGQLSIAWVMAQGAIPIPGTTKSDRLVENWEAGNVNLTDEELESIRKIITDAAPKGDRYGAASLAQVGR